MSLLAAPNGRAASVTLAPDLPFAVQVELTNRCNLRCRMCPLTSGTSSSSGSHGPVDDVVLEEVLAMARRCRLVVLAGFGEALLDPRCMDFLAALDAAGVKVRMATNGHPVTPAVARRLAALRHLVQVNVSVDGADPGTYRFVRGGRLDRALDGIAHLAEAFDDRGRLTVSAVAMRSTIAELAELPAVIAGRGARRLLVQGVVDYNDFSRSERLLDRPELVALLDDVAAACARHGVSLELSTPERTGLDGTGPAEARRRWYGPSASSASADTADTAGPGGWDERTTRRCTVPWELPFVDRDGVVFACCNAAAVAARPLGRIGPSTFAGVWQGEPYRRFRRDLLDGRTTPDVCRACTIVELGEHPLRAWAASLVPGGPQVRHGATPSVTIRVRNDGTRTWRQGDPVRVGTAAPRDWPSPLTHPAWLAATRAASFAEAEVAPGATATFTFPVAGAGPGAATVADLQLVVDGVCWLPGTRVTVVVRGPRPAAVAVARLLAACGRRLPAARRALGRVVGPAGRARVAALAAAAPPA